MSESPESIELVVESSETQDDGRRVARLPEPARRRLGVLSGDPVVIVGETEIVAKVWPADRGHLDESVVLDVETRKKAGVAINDTVTVRRAHLNEATAVTVQTTDTSISDTMILNAVKDRPITVGDSITLDGHSVRVIETKPMGTVHITDTTHVVVHETPATDHQVEHSTTSITYDDIGGLDDELAIIRETIELPLREPDLFDRLGIDPPTGVLLYGPPGTGKTLIAEAIANAVDATVFHISGPEITSKYKGESEERLREVFKQARESAPSIIFFDEIDAIAAKRDTGGDMESRVVAQLLSIMDGLDPRGNVIVIGATNRVDTLDPALRRPGRFDREIEIGVPDERGRRAILNIHAKDVPLTDDVDLDRLAARTHGFVGADLRALVTEAALVALRRHDSHDSITVSKADFDVALASIDPSAMREFVAETPTVGYTDVGGLTDAKQMLREAIEWPLVYPQLFEATGTDPPSGILLYGPPGTGKTLLARAVAHESEVNFIHVAGPELIDKYVGESERAVREVFERARQAAPTIVFFDEIDAIAARRGQGHDVTERVVSQLLTELDGLADNPNLIVLAATNRKEALDPALLRPGRLETHIEVSLPDETARKEILRVHTRDMPFDETVDIDELANRLASASGADIASIVREASMLAIRETVSKIGVEAANDRASEIRIRTDHFITAIEQFETR